MHQLTRLSNRQFILSWSVLTLVGLVIGIGLSLFVIGWGVSGANAVEALIRGALIGACVGIAQFLVLRTRIADAIAWILLTTFGFALGMMISEHLPPQFLSWWGQGSLFGLAVGLAQWPLLRASVNQAAWWLVGTGLASLVAHGVVGVNLVDLVGTNWPASTQNSLVIAPFVLVALVVSVVPGGVLVWLLQQPRQASSSGQMRRWFRGQSRIGLGIGLGLLLALMGPPLWSAATIPTASDQPWEILLGDEKVHWLEIDHGISPMNAPHIYHLPDAPNTIVLSSTLSEETPSFRWTPDGQELGAYVWKVNLTTFEAKPMPFGEFQALNPQKDWSMWDPTASISIPDYDFAGRDPIVFQSGSYVVVSEISKQAVQSPHLEVYANDTQAYGVAASISDLSYFEREQFVSGFPFGLENAGYQQVPYLSGLFHLELFDFSQSEQTLVHLQKLFYNWNTLPSDSLFGELDRLPDGRGCFLLYSNALVSDDGHIALIVL